MKNRKDLNVVKERLRSFFAESRRMPSVSEFQSLFGYRSKSGAARLITRLIDAGIVRKDSTGRLLPADKLKSRLSLLGSVQAGFPSPAEEELVDTLSLDEFLVQKPSASYLVKVSGDSMIDAGIHPGDMVIVERGRPAKEGDIVIAQVDEEWTMKYYMKKNGHVYLRPANSKYPIIKPKYELQIAGVVMACIRKYGN